VGAGAVWASATSDRPNTVATRILTNLLVIGSFGLLRISSGIRGALQTHRNRADRTFARRTHSASPVPGSSRRTSSVVTTQIFVGVDGTDYRRLREQRQTELREQVAVGGRQENRTAPTSAPSRRSRFSLALPARCQLRSASSVSKPVLHLHADLTRIGEVCSAEGVGVIEQVMVIAEVESGDTDIPVFAEGLAQSQVVSGMRG
jgi:hypothetical protein